MVVRMKFCICRYFLVLAATFSNHGWWRCCVILVCAAGQPCTTAMVLQMQSCNNCTAMSTLSVLLIYAVHWAICCCRCRRYCVHLLTSCLKRRMSACGSEVADATCYQGNCKLSESGMWLESHPFRKIEGIYVQQVMWHNQTKQVMRPYNPQGWRRHWQSKCTPLIHHLRSCHWEWIIPRSGKGLRIHCASLSTPPCPSYVAQAKPLESHSLMAACRACGRQSNDNQHSRQLHWSLHWNHQSEILPPRSWIMPTSVAMLSNRPSSAYGDPLGGAYTTAKNNGVAPERWNYSHNLVPSVLYFHRDT